MKRMYSRRSSRSQLSSSYSVETVESLYGLTRGPSSQWASDEEEAEEDTDDDERVVRPPKATSEARALLYASFGQTLDQSVEDLGIFAVVAMNVPEELHYLNRDEGMASMIFVVMIVLVIFLMLVLPSFIISSIESKLKCTAHASWINRLAGVSVFGLLYLSMYANLLEARILFFFAALSHARQRITLILGAIVKILCCGAVLIATYALFVVHPLPVDFLLNGFALSFLLTTDNLLMAAFRNSPIIAPYYRFASFRLENLIANARATDPDLLDEFATFHALSIPAKLHKLRLDFVHMRPFLAIYLVSTYLITFACAWAVGLLLWCLPEQSEIAL